MPEVTSHGSSMQGGMAYAAVVIHEYPMCSQFSYPLVEPETDMSISPLSSCGGLFFCSDNMLDAPASAKIRSTLRGRDGFKASVSMRRKKRSFATVVQYTENKSTPTGTSGSHGYPSCNHCAHSLYPWVDPQSWAIVLTKHHVQFTTQQQFLLILNSLARAKALSRRDGFKAPSAKT